MIAGNYSLIMFQAILPQILLVVLGAVVLITDLVLKKEFDRELGWVTAIGLAIVILISLVFARPGPVSIPLWGGMIHFDWLGFIFVILFMIAACFTAMLSIDYQGTGQRGEFYLLLIIATLGMTFMATSSDMIMLYLAIETTSIPLYVLAGFKTQDNSSTEAGFKYLLFGAMASAVMLYGFSLLYGFSGTTSIYSLATGLRAGTVPTISIVASLILVLVGFGFKISAVPFHFWAPDVYEGAPTPIAGFLSTASKAAGFVALIRFFSVVFPGITTQWGAIASALAVATMTLGNFLAMSQKNMKRMLAYSSIAHAGYILIGVAAMATPGISPQTYVFAATSVVFYIIAYLITNLAAFGTVTAFERISGSSEISSFNGMSRRAPGLSLIMMVAMLSLAGMPPLAGFISKFLIFASAVDAGLVWLAAIGVLNSIVGLYYYLTILKYVYLYRSEDENIPIPMTRPIAFSLGVLTVVIILIGTVFAPFFTWSSSIASSLF